MITNALVTGMSIGKTISQNVRSRPAPSTSAASSTSVGTFLRKLLYRSTPKEAAPPRCTRITLVSVHLGGAASFGVLTQVHQDHTRQRAVEADVVEAFHQGDHPHLEGDHQARDEQHVQDPSGTATDALDPIGRDRKSVV